MRASELEHGKQWDKHLNEINQATSADFSRPTKDERYFEYCDVDYKVVTRANSKLPVIYSEKIASANVVQKDPAKRDTLHKEQNVHAIEMEGAGVCDVAYYNDFGYLAVRGICDFCDGEKNDEWHNYAAATAAYTRDNKKETPNDKTGEKCVGVADL